MAAGDRLSSTTWAKCTRTKLPTTTLRSRRRKAWQTSRTMSRHRLSETFGEEKRGSTVPSGVGGGVGEEQERFYPNPPTGGLSKGPVLAILRLP